MIIDFGAAHRNQSGTNGDSHAVQNNILKVVLQI